MESLAAPFQWMGHSPGMLSGVTTTPPSCGVRVAQGGGLPTTLLWADLGLSPGAPRVRLRTLWLPPEAAMTTASMGKRTALRWHLARLRRRGDGRRVRAGSVEGLPQGSFTVEELSEALSEPCSTRDCEEEFRWREVGIGGDGFDSTPGQHLGLVQNVDLIIDADAGDIIGVVASCQESTPLVAAAITGASGANSSVFGSKFGAMTALAFTLGSGMGPGMEVPLQLGTEVPPPAWAFGYEVLQPRPQQAWPVQRSAGAVEILTRVQPDEKCHESLEFNLREFSRSCDWAFRYPLYIFHTARLEGIGVRDVLNWTDSLRFSMQAGLELRFLDVSDDFDRVLFGDSTVKLERLDLLWLDLTLPHSSRIRTSKPRRFQASYRHMCRFHTSTLLRLPIFASTRYLMHMDGDATLRCHQNGPDPIEEMQRSGAVYGLFEVGVEDPEYAQGWGEFVEEYVFLHEVKPPVHRALLSTRGAVYTKEDPAQPTSLVNASTDVMGVTWGTAWEVLDLGFFNSPEVSEFTRKVEQSLGNYRHNWGDHLVRSLQVQLFAPLERVRCFSAEEVPGSHGCRTETDWIYPIMPDSVCPDNWTGESLAGVQVSEDGSPWPCLELCNRLGCQGIDVIVFREEQSADCRFRDSVTVKERCLGGGVGGLAGEVWRGVGAAVDRPDVSIFALSRYRPIEDSVQRSLNCQRWRSELDARLAMEQSQEAPNRGWPSGT